MILKFEGFKMLNESFKSNIISKLFNDGELITNNEKDKALFNQVTDDEIIGIANGEEDAKKMLHNALGDMIETRYKTKRVWYRYGEDDWDDDVEDDFNQPYEVNKTVDEYSNWMFELNDGRYLVLSIETSELYHRYYEITGKRYNLKKDSISELKRKFIERKKFVEEHKDDLAKFGELVKFLKRKNLLDEFIGVANEKLKGIEAKYDEDDVAYTIEEMDNEFEDDIEFDFYGYDVQFYVSFFADYDAIYHKGSRGDYWTPPEPECYEYDNIHFHIKDMGICFDGDGVIFEFDYNPLFDKNIKIDFK